MGRLGCGRPTNSGLEAGRWGGSPGFVGRAGRLGLVGAGDWGLETMVGLGDDPGVGLPVLAWDVFPAVIGAEGFAAGLGGAEEGLLGDAGGRVGVEVAAEPDVLAFAAVAEGCACWGSRSEPGWLPGATGFAAATGLAGDAGLLVSVGGAELCVDSGDALSRLGAAWLAFLTDRMALLGMALLGAEEAGLPLLLSTSRIRLASASLIELLWLLTAIESCSAASSTSLFSRPRSLESS